MQAGTLYDLVHAGIQYGSFQEIPKSMFFDVYASWEIILNCKIDLEHILQLLSKPFKTISKPFKPFLEYQNLSKPLKQHSEKANENTSSPMLFWILGLDQVMAWPWPGHVYVALGARPLAAVQELVEPSDHMAHHHWHRHV